MTTSSFLIGDRRVGQDQPCFIVAEVSANHNQSLDRAVQIIRAARAAGADAVKLQTYTPDTLTIESDQDWFRVPSSTPWGGKTLYELYGEAYTPWEWHEEFFRVAASEGLICFSTPFDASAVDLLERLETPAYKVASFELVDHGLLEVIARTAKPVILSTGMATLDEIREAVATLRSAGAGPTALLKCTSAYPAPPESMNLRTIPHLADTFGAVVGLSDHTMGGAVAVAAVALGASVVQKHFTIARADGGPDSSFSMEPDEFAVMVADIRRVEAAFGRVSYAPTEQDLSSLRFRRSLFVVEDIEPGEILSDRNVRSIRPGQGLAPRHLREVVGRAASRRIPKGTPLSWDLVK